MCLKGTEEKKQIYHSSELKCQTILHHSGKVTLLPCWKEEMSHHGTAESYAVHLERLAAKIKSHLKPLANVPCLLGM